MIKKGLNTFRFIWKTILENANLFIISVKIRVFLKLECAFWGIDTWKIYPKQNGEELFLK